MEVTEGLEEAKSKPVPNPLNNKNSKFMILCYWVVR